MAYSENTEKWTIYLDMDGVCCDFLGGLLKLLNKSDLINNWPKGKAFQEVLQVPKTEYRKLMETSGYHFWYQLEEYPHFKTMYDVLQSRGDLHFLTSPGLEVDAPKGKMMWLHDRLGRDFDNIIMTRNKYKVAKPYSILIDDSEFHCRTFKEHGGESVLFPQDWNSGKHTGNQMLHVIKAVDDIISAHR